MATVWIPSLMQDLTEGKERVDADGANVGAIIDALDRRYQGLRDRLCVDGRLVPGVAIYIDGRVALRGLREPVQEDSEVQFLPAMGGG
jgi:molybdopterin converting factor small subunit